MVKLLWWLFLNIDRLKEIREDRDLKQEYVADCLGIKQQQYSRYELGENQMTYEQLITLADFYKVSIDYILYNTDVRKPYPKSIIKK